jgi:Tfp pilus assembly protein PilF
VTGALVRDYLNKAQADAQRAITLAPDLGEAHLALAVLYKRSLDFTRASQEFTRALALAPGSARQLRNYGVFGVMMGHTQAGLGAAHRSVMLDPLNSDTHSDLGKSLLLARRYDEALAALKDAKALDPSEGGDMPYGLDMLTT